ncbi:hypothetical protein C8A01DRAFT_42191 [Parachaetomium inaequale]|uniref:Uncharacterized protein n=1 Tax=Parachaetomium inaequale TaxID=2588326 RepID=A0AAN6P4C6_9PEZI|nr:hypothetical protein C8A01DRAFT_42191 [Parachaetomium inaequale]
MLEEIILIIIKIRLRHPYEDQANVDERRYNIFTVNTSFNIGSGPLTPRVAAAFAAAYARNLITNPVTTSGGITIKPASHAAKSPPTAEELAAKEQAKKEKYRARRARQREKKKTLRAEAKAKEAAAKESEPAGNKEDGAAKTPATGDTRLGEEGVNTAAKGSSDDRSSDRMDDTE